MVAGVALLQVLWLANRWVVENYWPAATEDDDEAVDGETRVDDGIGPDE